MLLQSDMSDCQSGWDEPVPVRHENIPKKHQPRKLVADTALSVNRTGAPGMGDLQLRLWLPSRTVHVSIYNNND